MEQLHEIRFEQISDGSIRLEQQSGHGERDVIHLHPEQLRFIARRMAGLKSDTAELIEDLERHIAILTGDIEFIVTEKNLRRQIIDCDDGVELITRLDGLYDLALEFDGGRLYPRCAQEPHEAAAGGATTKTGINPPSTNESATKRDFGGSSDIHFELEPPQAPSSTTET